MSKTAPEPWITVVRIKRRVFRKGVLSFAGRTMRAPYAWRDPRRSPYEILVAEILLKRTTATAASRVYASFLERFPSLRHLAAASGEEIRNAIAPLGLQEQRGRSLASLAGYLLSRNLETLPADLQELLRIPGVGDYTARSVLSFAYNMPYAVVDSNVERILRRMFARSLQPRPNTSLFQRIADFLIPPDQHRQFNYGMLDLGSLVCLPSYPRCSSCPLQCICDAHIDGHLSQRGAEKPGSCRA